VDKRTKKTLSLDNAMQRMGKYCSYTERSIAEVKKKLKELNVAPEDTDTVLQRLAKMGFLNEDRFATAFAGGKFRIKKWGKKRIEIEMKRKGLSSELIEKGLKQLPEADYLETLEHLLKKKQEQIMRSGKDEKDYDTRQRNRQKLIRFALQKGYEMDLVMTRVRKLFPF
jgi:regulatory protein